MRAFCTSSVYLVIYNTNKDTLTQLPTHLTAFSANVPLSSFDYLLRLICCTNLSRLVVGFFNLVLSSLGSSFPLGFS